MKRFAFLVLVFTAVAITNGAGVVQTFYTVQSLGRSWYRDTVRRCLNDTDMTWMKIQAAERLVETIQNDNVDDGTLVMKYNNYLACVLQHVQVAVFEGASIKTYDEMLGAEDKENIEMCLKNVGSTEEEIQAMEHQLRVSWLDDLREESKRYFEKHILFSACMMEKKEMLKDSKLVVDKIIKSLPLNYSGNKDVVKECLNALNNNNEITQGDRVIRTRICVRSGNPEN